MPSTTVAWRSTSGIRLEKGVTKVLPMPAAVPPISTILSANSASGTSPRSTEAADTAGKRSGRS